MSSEMDPDIKRLYVMILKYGWKVWIMVRSPIHYHITLSLPHDHQYCRNQYTRLWRPHEIFIYHHGNQ